MFMSYRGAIWIRMNPDRDSEADSVEECLPKVPERHNSDSHTVKAPAGSKYCTPLAGIWLVRR